jgi:hypothetical protein
MTEAELKQGFYAGEWEVQPMHNLIVGPEGEAHLEPMVMDLLLILAERPGDVFEKQELIGQAAETGSVAAANSKEPGQACDCWGCRGAGYRTRHDLGLPAARRKFDRDPAVRQPGRPCRNLLGGRIHR